MLGKFLTILSLTVGISIVVSAADQSFEVEQTSGDTINYKDVTNMRQGRWIFTGKMKRMDSYEDDQVVEEGSYTNNRKNGVWKRYFTNSNVKSEVNYTNNRPDGDYKEYYSDGTLQEAGTWKNNKNVGNFIRQHPNGEVSQEFAFNEKGKREGPQKYYWDNGQIRIEGNWNSGQENGVVTEYTSTGEVKSEKYYGEGGVLDAAKTKVYEVKEVVQEVAPPEPAAEVQEAVIVKKSERKNIPA